MYTIALADDQTKTKQIHRTLLKAVVGAGSPQCATASPLPHPDQSEDELSCDGDLLVLRHDAPQTTSTYTTAVTQTTPRLLRPQSAVAPTVPDPVVAPAVVTVGLPSAQGAPLPATYPNTDGGAIQRTTQSTAGHHPNVYHLPRPVGGGLVHGAANLPSPASNAVSALFRPWN